MNKTNRNIAFLIILIPFFVSGQIEYFSEGTQWRITSGWTDGPNCLWTSEKQYFIKGDSLVGGIKYFKLHHKTHLSNFYSNPACGSSGFTTGFVSLIRQDSSKVYLYNYFGNSSDSLLFDFELTAGSIVTDHLFYTQVTDTIQSIDSILIGNNYRRRFWTGKTNPHIEFFIEGIGHNNGLLEPYNSCIGCSSSLNCFMKDSIISPILDNSKCNFTLSINETKSTSSFEIYPIPACNSFFVNPFLNEPYTYELIDYTGQIITRKQTQGMEEIECGHLSNGFIFLKITQNQSSFIKKITVANNK